MSLDTLSSEEKTKLKNVIDQGMKVLQEIEDLNGGLKDTVKAVADELSIKPALLSRALKAAYKASIATDKEDFDTVEEILVVTGRF